MKESGEGLATVAWGTTWPRSFKKQIHRFAKGCTVIRRSDIVFMNELEPLLLGKPPRRNLLIPSLRPNITDLRKAIRDFGRSLKLIISISGFDPL